MRGSLVVLALAITPVVARVSSAQSDSAAALNSTSKQCIQRDRGNPSDSGLANRADPTTKGNKDCTPLTGKTTITGTVFFDVDHDGLLGPDEVGISSWEVVLSGPVSQSVLTDGNGAYSFTGLTAGTYTVCLNPVPGWTQTAPSSGLTCPNSTGFTIVAPLQATDSTIPNINFGYFSNPS